MRSEQEIRDVLDIFQRKVSGLKRRRDEIAIGLKRDEGVEKGATEISIIKYELGISIMEWMLDDATQEDGV